LSRHRLTLVLPVAASLVALAGAAVFISSNPLPKTPAPMAVAKPPAAAVPPAPAVEVAPVLKVPNAGDKSFTVIARVDTPQEVEYIAHGGILQYVLRQRAAQMKQA